MKRLIDITCSALGLIILGPLLIVLVALVKFKLGSPVFFKHQRPGIHGIAFSMTKFRTMLDAYDNEGNPLPDVERLTPFGGFLRRLSLDELPELWNVLKGDMSLVGPRPLLMEYLPLYSVEQAKRHNAKPGITGWAQINGRNAISWDEKFKLDVWYVENQSFWLDMKILFLTLYKVLKKEGISHDGEATMSRFEGGLEGDGCGE
ncbi:MAG: sugar transferase [Pseudomonadales bacterium]|nr:sugar transferase [Pseudomonadales bacterium]